MIPPTEKKIIDVLIQNIRKSCKKQDIFWWWNLCWKRIMATHCIAV